MQTRYTDVYTANLSFIINHQSLVFDKIKQITSLGPHFIIQSQIFLYKFKGHAPNLVISPNIHFLRKNKWQH